MFTWHQHCVCVRLWSKFPWYMDSSHINNDLINNFDLDCFTKTLFPNKAIFYSTVQYSSVFLFRGQSSTRNTMHTIKMGNSLLHP